MKTTIAVFLVSLSILCCQQITNAQGSKKVAPSDSINARYQNQRIIEGQKERTELLLKESERNFDLASKIIDWSAMFFAILVVFLGIAGWIGARRFGQIDETGKEMANLLDEMKDELSQMQILRNSNQDEIDALKTKIERERKEIMEKIYYMGQGELAFEKGNLDEAIEIYTRIIKLKQDSPEAHFMLGSAYTKNGDLDNAIKHLKTAIEQKPDYYEAYYNLGRTYRKANKFDLSIEYLRKSLELNPKYVNAATNLGHTYFRKGEIERALEWYQRSIEIDPASSVSYLPLARIAYWQGEVVQAMGLYNTAKEKIQAEMRHGKIRVEKFYHLGEIQLVLNNINDAESYYTRALSMNLTKEALHTMKFNLDLLKSSPTPPVEIDKFLKLIEDRLRQ